MAINNKQTELRGGVKMSEGYQGREVTHYTSQKFYAHKQGEIVLMYNKIMNKGFTDGLRSLIINDLE